MSDIPSRNLTLSLDSFGPITIQPDEYSEDEVHRSKYIIFPDQIHASEFEAAVDWATHSEAPIFCTQRELKNFEREGFGAYRFNVLRDYQEIGFENGSLKFVPAFIKQQSGFKQWLRELGDAMGIISRKTFHVIAKSNNGKSQLYLSSPYISKSEWSVLIEEKPDKIFGSPRYPAFYWLALSEKLGSDIQFYARTESFAGAAQKIFPDSDGHTSHKVLKNIVWVPLERGSGQASLLF